MTAAASSAVPATPALRSWLRQPARREYLALGAILVVAAAIRFWNLAGPSFWLDELYSIHFARLPLSQLWSEWMVREPVPPLFYSLLKAWVALFGEGEFAVRSLSAFFGVLAVGGIFLLARALFSANIALFAALLAAVSSQQLEFSQQVRGYALGLMAAALALYAVVRLTDRWLAGAPARRSWPDLLLYVGACTLAFYTHTTFFLLPLLANLYMGWVWAFRTPRQRDTALTWIGANIVLTALCLWWVWITFLQMQAGAEMISWIQQPDARLGALKLAHTIAPRSFEPVKLLLAAIFGGLFLWGAWRLPLERRVFALVFAAGVPLLLFAISQKQPIYMERTLLWMQAIYLPCIAGGILMLPVARLRAPLAAAACLLMLADTIHWRGTEYREPWREVAAVIGERAGPNDAVLTYSRDASVNLSYYCDRTPCRAVASLAIASPDRLNVLWESFRGEQVSPGDMAATLARFDRIWVVSRGPVDDPRHHLGGAAELELDDMLTTDPVKLSYPPLNDMTLSVWRPLPASTGGDS